MKILITCPRLHLGGGVSNYYDVIKDWLSVDADYFELGKLKEREFIIEKITHSCIDTIGFYALLKTTLKDYHLIHLNPSFDYKAILRDGIVLRIAKKFGKKALVMFHGWNTENVKVIEKLFFKFFLSTYNKADGFIVLASDFKEKLRDWGFKQPIYVETTPVDDRLLNGFSMKQRIKRIDSDKDIQLLFLARIEKEKGICETLDAVRILSEKYPALHLAVAGEGSFMDEARNIGNRSLKSKIAFLSFVKGEEKKKVFQNSDIYIFPTYHGEGMPTSVLEAMAFGLPVITRPVGGLRDFFIDGEHGFMTESKDSQVIASLIERIILGKDLWKRMSATVHEYAKERFMASKVANRLEEIYTKTIN